MPTQIVPAGLDEIADDRLYTAGGELTKHAQSLLQEAKRYFVGHDEAVGVLFIDETMKYPMFLKSGFEGGPWGGCQRGGIPRIDGWAFTQKRPHRGNIVTHVEGHASAIMWQRNVKCSYLLVDRAMCSVCHNRLYTTLPPGSTMFVYSDEEGKTTVKASHAS
jgi:hypothetical protein